MAGCYFDYFAHSRHCDRLPKRISLQVQALSYEIPPQFKVTDDSVHCNVDMILSYWHGAVNSHMFGREEKEWASKPSHAATKIMAGHLRNYSSVGVDYLQTVLPQSKTNPYLECWTGGRRRTPAQAFQRLGFQPW
jgi:hypothetical protein